MGGPDMAPHTPRPAPRSSWGLDRVSEPEGAPTSPPAPRSSWGLDRVSEPDTAGASPRPGAAGASPRPSRPPSGLHAVRPRLYAGAGALVAAPGTAAAAPSVSPV